MSKNDSDILFPEVVVGDIKVKPWSFGALFDISPFLDVVLERAEAKGIIQEIESGEGFFKITTMAKLFSITSKELLKIMSITLNVPEENIKNLSMEEGVQLAYLMFNQNKTTIVNAIKNAGSPPPQKKT